jgi:hypothetical protein
MMSKEFKRLTLTIDGWTAAFGDTPEEAMSEVSRILNESVMPFLSTGYNWSHWPFRHGKDEDGHPDYTKLVDLNGNIVGRIEVEYETTVGIDAEIDF